MNETGLRGKRKSLYGYSATPQNHILAMNVQRPRGIETGSLDYPRRSLTGYRQVKVGAIITYSEDYAMRIHTLCG